MGVILMAVGVLGLVISLFLLSQARDRATPAARERYVERDPLA